MSQSNVIFAFLFAAFVVFITMRGDLPRYLGFLLSDGPQSPGGGPSKSNLTDISPSSGMPSIDKFIGSPPTASDFMKLFGG